jgi:hypothetical protein
VLSRFPFQIHATAQTSLTIAPMAHLTRYALSSLQAFRLENFKERSRSCPHCRWRAEARFRIYLASRDL